MQDGYFGPWASGENWARWMESLDAFRAGLGALLNVKPASICPQSNVSSALTKILFSLPKPAGRDIILLSKLDFPTIGFVAKQAEQLGYQLQFIEGDPSEFERWNAAITSRTAFVLVTHALSNTSRILPVEAICARARTVGAVSVVDVAQSLGAVPVDLGKWKADFVIGTGVKFLCFGPGACFLYAAPEILPRCEPLDVGWFSHENPFEMDIEQFRYAPDAMRFFGGTPSPAAYVLANRAMKLWKKIGLEAAHDRIQQHLSILHAALPPGAARSPADPTMRGATLVLKTSFGANIEADLIAEAVKYDKRKQGYRFSVHGYTSATEIDKLAAMLSQLQG
jgi:selenocysteine lyase/cysteine desulfurase